ncbi:MAG: glutamyl-tRNA amidotransferase subunit A [Myxococcales bacterium]
MYDLEPIRAPRLAGPALRALAALASRPRAGSLLREQLLRQVGVDLLRTAQIDDPPQFEPRFSGTSAPPASPTLDEVVAGPTPVGHPWATLADYRRAYAEEGRSPVDVARRLLDALSASEREEPALRVLIAQQPDDLLHQAERSAERWRAGRPLGPFDGVPVAIKDEVDQRGYPTTVGTRFHGSAPATADATTVARLRAAGALLFGKANMHEIGLGVTGLNPHHGPARNPFDPARATGGSSSGSAAAVAAGLCPVALGADGGGSIRIPAALCGLVGLKPTFGRVSEHGAAPLCWSVAHIGPLAGTARDAAAAYMIMAGEDPEDPHTLGQPKPHLTGFGGSQDLRGVTLGVFKPWFEDADPGVVTACERLLDGLRAAGATIREVSIEGLRLASIAHMVTIAVEMVASQLPWLKAHGADYGPDVRINLALARDMGGADYVQAQRVRARMVRQMLSLLSGVDAIVTPATGCTAPPLPRDALQSGESNLELLGRIMRYAPLANLTGLPAISFPAGWDADGLPVGLQAIGRPWDEALLLRLAHAAEGMVEHRRPARVYSPL